MLHVSGMRWRAVGALASCLLALAACGGGSDDAAEPEAEETSASAPSGTPTPVDQTDGQVVVADAGAEPRIVPTLDLQTGERYVSTMRSVTTSTFNKTSTPSIPMTMVASIEVQDVTDERVTIRATFDDVEVESAGLPKDLVAGVEDGLEAMRDLAVTIDQSPTGELLDTRFSLPDNAPATSHQVVEQIAASLTTASATLPTEPVGEGASWTVTDTTESNGLTIEQTATYRLEELDGDRYVITSAVEGEFLPTESDGIELVRGSLTGTAETAGRFGELYPRSATSDSSTSFVMKAGGRRAESATDIELTMTTRVR